jgi:hypothetical protein
MASGADTSCFGNRRSSSTAASRTSASSSASARSCGDSVIVARTHQIEGNVDEHVFLAANHAATSGFLEEGPRVDVVAFGSDFGVPQKAGVHPCVAEGQRSRSTRTGRCCKGRTMSSAASSRACRSQPWLQSIRSAAAMNTSSGALPAPAPCPSARHRHGGRRVRPRRSSWPRPATGCGGHGCRLLLSASMFDAGHRPGRRRPAWSWRRRSRRRRRK